jgi:hypothetical protein
MTLPRRSSDFIAIEEALENVSWEVEYPEFLGVPCLCQRFSGLLSRVRMTLRLSEPNSSPSFQASSGRIWIFTGRIWSLVAWLDMHFAVYVSFRFILQYLSIDHL